MKRWKVNNYRNGVLGVLAVILGGCSSKLMNPYNETFMCERTDNYGRCANPTEAYDDALGLGGTAERKKGASGSGKKEEKKADEGGGKAADKGVKEKENREIADYRKSLYRELKGLIGQPKTPVVRAAKTLRVLIMPYPGGDQRRLYEHRYVHVIVEPPRFVMGLEEEADTVELMPFEGDGN